MVLNNVDSTVEQQNRGDHHDREHQHQQEHQDLELGFPLTRQSTIYSLTLDEIQNTVCEPGKSFGSMNMDEFLANIWNVEEGHAINATVDSSDGPHHPTNGDGGPSLYRQGSLALPGPLSRKTVDEVWSEIHSEKQPLHRLNHLHPESTGNATRQPTFGEMTLEDFLVKAGVARERYGPCPSSPQPPQSQHHHQQYGMSSYQMGTEGAGFGHVVGVGYGDHQNLGTAGNGFGFGGNGKRGDGNDYGGGGDCFGRMGNGYVAQQQMGVAGSPVSPPSSDGLEGGQVDYSGQYGGMEMGGAARGGRKRAADGTVEKVVERRQRRMIKNRESAARSRARKQAYTVELEAELNHLKEENARLKEEERRVLAMRKQMLLESMAERSQTNAAKTAWTLRRCSSCP